MTKNEEPLAGMVSADDLSHQDHMDGERTDRFSIIDEMRAAFADVTAEEIEREAARALAEVRVEMRARLLPVAGSSWKDRDLSPPEG